MDAGPGSLRRRRRREAAGRDLCQEPGECSRAGLRARLRELELTCADPRRCSGKASLEARLVPQNWRKHGDLLQRVEEADEALEEAEEALQEAEEDAASFYTASNGADDCGSDDEEDEGEGRGESTRELPAEALSYEQLKVRMAALAGAAEHTMALYLPADTRVTPLVRHPMRRCSSGRPNCSDGAARPLRSPLRPRAQ